MFWRIDHREIIFLSFSKNSNLEKMIMSSRASNALWRNFLFLNTKLEHLLLLNSKFPFKNFFWILNRVLFQIKSFRGNSTENCMIDTNYFLAKKYRSIWDLFNDFFFLDNEILLRSYVCSELFCQFILRLKRAKLEKLTCLKTNSN